MYMQLQDAPCWIPFGRVQGSSSKWKKKELLWIIFKIEVLSSQDCSWR